LRLRSVYCCLFFLLTAYSSAAQSPTGTISGIVTDPTGAAVAGAEIVVVNDATRVQFETQSNREGIYFVPNLLPGNYRVQVAKTGFKTIIKPDIIINVQDALSINFDLPLGAIAEIVTIQGGAPLVNTDNAAVSTIIDRQFVENLPLNGRSFNTLLQLSPGVVIAPTTGAAATGQFSIAGQRSDANNFSVDGVSANFGVTGSLSAGQSGTGSSQAFSALGGTSSLVSVEALQEFRIVTSSFAPEFGRAPGGQVLLTTRAGTNDLHGGVYEYFRNDVLDANDWFANASGQDRAAERHNDFGAFLGGPIWKDHTFFFASYEGAQLRLPQTSVIDVASSSARASAPAALAPLLNAYPIPNGPVSEDGQTAEFTGTYSNSGTLDAGSIRIDHKFGDRYLLFGRFNDAPSEIASRVSGLSMLQSTTADTKTLTVGLNMTLSSKSANSLRGNYSTQNASVVDSFDSIGGSVSLSPSFILGSFPSKASLIEFQTEDTEFLAAGALASDRTRQLNFADDLNRIVGDHQLKFGTDYRAIFLDADPSAQTFFFDATSVPSYLATGQGSLSVTTKKRSKLLTQTYSLYGQDTWRVTPRLTLTYGLRWELSPAPSGRGTTTLASWENIDDPALISLAPSGKGLWKTTYGNFAPRVGAAYSLTPSGDFVIRAGWGIFYDLGVGQAATLATQFPNAAALTTATVNVPISDATPYLPSFSLQPPFPGAYGASPNLKLPRSNQWNVALEKSLPGNQVITATYVGQAGRDLLRDTGYYRPNPTFSSFFYLTTNDAFSNYDALQLQYRKLISARVQGILNYTFSHSLDNSSTDVVGRANVISAAGDYASSDFDVRHSFSGALHFEIPSPAKSRVVAALTKDWAMDLVAIARTGFPFNATSFVASPVLGYALIRPDLVAGQPLWIANPSAAAGRSLNPLAFAKPPAGQQGTEGRNDIAGFGLTQFDLSTARKFPITERVNLQFRADAFNLLNHPNFTNPSATVFAGPTQLESTKMLNQGLGGLNPLFQEGGPRSLQLSLRLTF
jgi:Carboxypeptidase regulatory-like domain/TonB dependent receptor/TonB-dependent Receptor Plug Domain